MSTFIATNITAANGVVITPSVLKFANGAVLNVGNSSIEQGNGQPIVNAGASIAYGTSVVNSSLITIPALTMCGSLLSSVGGIVNTQIFTANGTWTNPNNALSLTGNEQVFVMAWGGGGFGGQGAGGGACVLGVYFISNVGNTATITVGPGGGVSGGPGGNSVFAPTGTGLTMTAYGGGGSDGSSCGGGGGWLGVGGLTTAGEPLGGAAAGAASTFGGGGAATSAGGDSILGGGGGGKGAGSGGVSVYGGAGGTSTMTVSTSVFGGSGANATVAATTPGGAGGSTNTNGARGEVRVWVIR